MRALKYRILVWAALVSGFSSCSGGNGAVKDSDCVVIDMEQALEGAEVVCLSKYASSIEYIPLETLPEGMLGRVTAFTEGDGKFYFGSGQDNDGLKVFDDMGKFVGKIGDVGRGPGEYSKVMKLLYDDDNERIAVVDVGKVIFYGADAGEKAVEVCLPDEIGNARIAGCNDNGKLVVLAKERNDVTGSVTEICYIVGPDGNILERVVIGPEMSQIVEMEHGKIVFSSGSTLVVNGDDIFSLCGSLDTLYRVEANGVEPELVLDYGSYKPLTQTQDVMNRLMVSASSIFEADGFILFGFIGVNQFDQVVPDKSKQRGSGYMLYDKSEKRAYVMKHDREYPLIGFKNDLDGGMNFAPRYIVGNSMYRVENASSFIEYAEKSTSAKMKEVAAMLDEDSNPVLVKVVLK